MFKVNCIKKVAATQSSDPEVANSIAGTPWNPPLDERRACWTTNRSQRARGRVASTNAQPVRSRIHSETILLSTRRRITIGRIHGCIGCNAAREGRVAKPQVWNGETRLKMRSCLVNPMTFAGDTRNRSDDVMQWEYRWSPDLDVLMRYHLVKWLANGLCRSSQEQTK